MQVLAGKYKGKRLQSADTSEVRPTARRLRESLFELLAPHLSGTRFLDLCAGSGAVGIEALSRGASHSTFVDRSPEMREYLNANLGLCDVSAEQSTVVEEDAIDFLRGARIHQQAVWDIAFFDPPYATDYLPLIEMFSDGGLLKKKGGILVIEHRSDYELRERFGILRRWRVICHGESCLSFYERKR